MLHTQTVEPTTFSLLKSLQAIGELQDFSLVGGTALSLHFGHRLSIDLDLFSTKKFEPESIVELLIAHYGNRVVIESKNIKWGVFCFIDDVKVDIIHYPHACLFPPETIEGIRLFDVKDIAAMKINAILGRGKKKDFYDLSELLEHFTVSEIIGFHKAKYPQQNLLISIPQAITYFEDAEEGEDPISLKGQTWEGVKSSIQQKVREFLS
jgi:hypothetical protein